MPTPTTDLLAALVSALADAVADRLAERLAKPPAPTHYTADRLPPGCTTWRAARERARAMGVPLVRVGRCVVIPADAWTAALERQTVAPSSPRGVLVSDRDAATLRALGVLA